MASVLLWSACSSTKTITTGNFEPSYADTDSLVSALPDYSDEISTLTGSGRAIVSEPGNSDRVTIDFKTNRELSLLTIKNRIGIEGGKMLVDQDSILIYDRIEKKAQKISIYDGRMTSLNELASVNILDLINFTVDANDVIEVTEDNNSYKLRLSNRAEVFIEKKTGRIWQVLQPRNGPAPYSKLLYEGYGELKGYTFPRKITIFSSDGDSKVAFLVRSLDINPGYLNFTIDIPNDVEIQRL